MNNFIPAKAGIQFLILICVVALAWPAPASAIALRDLPLPTPFGGQVLIKSWQVCLLPAPPPVFTVPIPFLYIVVGPPNPAKLYYWYGISKKYRRFTIEVTSWVLGMYLPGIDELKNFCINGAALPPADGVIQKIGTSCPGGQYDECERRLNLSE